MKEKEGKKLLATEWNELDAGNSFIPKLDTAMKELFANVEMSQAGGEKITALMDQQLLAWFKKCWTAVGGEHSKIPTYVALDKEYTCRNITTGEILEEIDTAKSLGYTVDGLDF